jgi:hypothetical protein
MKRKFFEYLVTENCDKRQAIGRYNGDLASLTTGLFTTHY